MVHRRVAHHRHVVEVARRDRLTRAERGKQLIDAAARRLVQLVAAAVVDGLREPGDDVFAKAHLRVLEGLLVDLAAALQVEQVGDDLGGADIDGHAPDAALGVGRLGVDRTPLVTGHGGSKPAVAQRVGQLSQHPQGQFAGPQSSQEALLIGARVVQRRGLESDDLAHHGRPRRAGMQARGGKDLPASLGGAHLYADALRERRRLAGKAPALGQLGGRQLADFGLGGLTEAARAGPHQALAAGPATGAIDRQIDRAAGHDVQQGLSAGDLDGHADGLDEYFGHGAFPRRGGRRLAAAARTSTLWSCRSRVPERVRQGRARPSNDFVVAVQACATLSRA